MILNNFNYPLVFISVHSWFLNKQILCQLPRCDIGVGIFYNPLVIKEIGTGYEMIYVGQVV